MSVDPFHSMSLTSSSSETHVDIRSNTMVALTSINSPLWLFLENYVYKVPSPPPRKRTKPMEVICVGLPRSATESLQHALLTLGYDYTYHGWDIVFEEPSYAQEWSKLARRKFCPMDNIDGDCEITAEDFDKVLGHSVAVTDAAGSVFASEMIKAYPNAKVVLNVRRDLDKWHQSAVKNLGGVNNSWIFYWMSFFGKDAFWAWHVYERLLWAGMFRCIDSTLDVGIKKQGKWIYREHSSMIRGLVPKDNLLEWSVEDGWEPLCKFLGKKVSDVEFPRTNDAAGFKGREAQAMALWFKTALKNTSIFLAVIVLIVAVLWKLI